MMIELIWRRGLRVAFLSLAVLMFGYSLTTAQTSGGSQSDTRAGTASETAARLKGVSFEVDYPSLLGDRPITGRVYVMLGTKDARREPRFGPDWFRPQPFFSRDVRAWKPGQTVRIDSTSLGYPGPLESVAPGAYAIQAVVRLNPDTHSIGTGEGNAYGPVVQAELRAGEPITIRLAVDQRVGARKFQETDRVKLAELPSPLLSRFLHRPVKHRAAVILPPGAEGKKLPAVYIIPGFGGDHHMAQRLLNAPPFAFARDLVRIVLDPDCGTGHHVFADSATNGPRGKALVEEFIPYLEKTYPIAADPRARLLNGHSSGGWSSLWLQVTYPDVFGGTWSTSPDPVDFRDFQRVNIYAAHENIYRDSKDQRRPVARMGSRPFIFYDSFSKLEEVLGPGGQLGSFEAVFSPAGADGQPRRLWNRTSGAIDPEVARAWEAYDIRLVLERNWERLGPRLRGKLHVITGGMDTFYLEGAVQLLKESLEKLKSDAIVEIVPGRDHSSILDARLAQRIDREMTASVAAFLKAAPAAKAAGLNRAAGAVRSAP